MHDGRRVITVIAFPAKLSKTIRGVCCMFLMGDGAAAQLSDLWHSRQRLPSVSDTSEVGIVVDMDSAQDLMQPAAIIATLQPRLESLGYRVALALAHSPDGRWLQINCQALSKKIRSRSLRDWQQVSDQGRSLGPPCQ